MITKYIKTTIAFVLLTQAISAQKFLSPKKGPNVGGSINLVNFENYTKTDPGFSLMFWNGLTKHIDYSVRYNGLFSKYAIKNSTNKGYAGELDLSFHLRALSDDHFLNPFISAGVSGGHYGTWDKGRNGSYDGKTNWAALVPLGGGLQFNFNSKAYMFLQAAYRYSPTDAHLDNNMFYSLGFTKALKSKKTAPKTLPPAPPSDRDKDGVIDSLDACPDVAGLASLKGCPDKDGDGIADKDDKCPDVAGLDKYNGCPIPDTDKDGINDEEDKCPDVAGLAKYGGCPIPDTDKDGINDEEDKCPTVPGVASRQGCPVPDTDGDGINDDNDKCPDLAGSADNFGCPVYGIQPFEILFNTGSAVLLPAGKNVLNKAADYFKTNTAVNLSINGHTDNTGSDKINNPLSVKRAVAAKTYLVKKGIAADRLTTEGNGSVNPVADNNTADGRKLNRRVEVRVKQ